MERDCADGISCCPACALICGGGKQGFQISHCSLPSFNMTWWLPFQASVIICCGVMVRVEMREIFVQDACVTRVIRGAAGPCSLADRALRVPLRLHGF